MTSKQKVFKIDRFLGLNLKADPMELNASRAGYELAVATNVDITDNKKVRRRKGYTSARTDATRKIWASSGLFLSVEGTNLVKLNDLANPVVIRSDIHTTNNVSFTEALDGGEVFYSDGRITGKFDIYGQPTDWGVEEPAREPSTSSTNGALFKGCYHIATTFTHNDGRESGTGEAIKHTLSSDGGISLSGIAVPSSGNIAAVNIYASEANGSTLYRRTSLSPGTTSYTITSRNRTKELQTQFLSPPPPSQHIAYSASRVVVAVENFLFLSQPFSYHLFNLGEGFLTFPKEITLISPTLNGVYVSAGAMYYINLTEEIPRLRRVSKEPAVPGTTFQINGAEIGEGDRDEVFAGWVAENGVILGSEAGSLQNMTEGRIDIGTSSAGAALARKTDGITQIVTTLLQPKDANLHIGDVVVATVKKKGIAEDFNVIDQDGNPVVDEFNEPVIYQV